MKELVDKNDVLKIIDNIETDFSYWAITDGIRCKDCCYRLDCPLDGFEYCTWHNSFVDTDAACSYGKTNLED